MKFTNQTGKDNYAIRAWERYANPNMRQKTERYRTMITIEAYEAFMSLKVTAKQLAETFRGLGVDFRGTTKGRFATYYLANEWSLQKRKSFNELVELYGCRNPKR